MSRWFACILVALLGVYALPASAQTRAWLDRTQVTHGETATLNIETTDSVQQIDYRPLEAQFDADFSQVRVHSDRKAAEATGALGARAFTVGRHIAFNRGEYRPASTSGRQLLAHELTHVVQQSEVSTGRAAFKPDAGEEREAQVAADRAMQGLAVQAGALSKGGATRIQADEGKHAGAKKADSRARKSSR